MIEVTDPYSDLRAVRRETGDWGELRAALGKTAGQQQFAEAVTAERSLKTLRVNSQAAEGEPDEATESQLLKERVSRSEIISKTQVKLLEAANERLAQAAGRQSNASELFKGGDASGCSDGLLLSDPPECAQNIESFYEGMAIRLMAAADGRPAFARSLLRRAYGKEAAPNSRLQAALQKPGRIATLKRIAGLKEGEEVEDLRYRCDIERPFRDDGRSPQP